MILGCGEGLAIQYLLIAISVQQTFLHDMQRAFAQSPALPPIPGGPCVHSFPAVRYSMLSTWCNHWCLAWLQWATSQVNSHNLPFRLQWAASWFLTVAASLCYMYTNTLQVYSRRNLESFAKTYFSPCTAGSEHASSSKARQLLISPRLICNSPFHTSQGFSLSWMLTHSSLLRAP